MKSRCADVVESFRVLSYQHFILITEQSDVRVMHF